MTKQVQLFFDLEDEKQFSSIIGNGALDTVFIDSEIWEEPTPVVVTSIDQCKDRYAYIWPRNLYPSLPYVPRIGGSGFVGPQNGPVIEFSRCTPLAFETDRSELLSGRLAWGSTPEYPGYEEMRRFVKEIFSAANQFAVLRVQTDVRNQTQTARDLTPGTYLVGPNALRRCRQRMKLLDRATRIPFKPV